MVSSDLYSRISNFTSDKSFEWRTVGRNRSRRVHSYDREYFKLMFEGVSQEVSRSNYWSTFESIYNEVSKGNWGGFSWFKAGIELTYSDTEVQDGGFSPTAKFFARHPHSSNYGTKLVSWRDDMLRPGGMGNDMQHQVASFLLTNNHMTLPALTITTGNEILNTRRDFAAGNLWRALRGQPGADGRGTAFEWSDIRNNLIGIGRAWGL